MFGLSKLAMAGAIAGAFVLSVAAVGLALASRAPASAQGGPSLAIDVNPAGNTAVLLSTRDVCVEVRKGDTFQVDLTAEDMVGLSAWEAYLGFDETIVQITDRDVQQFLASTPDGNVFDISESVPDGDAPYRVGGANISDPPVGVDGAGVLARLTLKATGAGLTSLSLTPIQTDAGRVGPTFTNAAGSQIADSNGDSFFDGPMLDAQVAVDQPCPGGGGVAPAALGGGGGGLAWWVFLGIAAAIVAAAGLGGVAFIAMRRTGPNTTA